MVKAKEKKVEGAVTTSQPQGQSIPSGMQAKDLSEAKRVELFTKAFEKFKADMAETFGLGLGCELAGYPNAIVPKMVLVDLLKMKNEQQAQANQA